MNSSLNPGRVLVVAAHPDDEVLGAGAAIARFVREGSAVASVILGRGVSSRYVQESSFTSPQRHKEEVALAESIRQAHAILGDELLAVGDFPDNKMDSVPLLDVIRFVAKAVEDFRPAWVLTHGAGDVNVDHRMVHEAVLAATRSQPGSCVDMLGFFPILSSTEWRPPGSQSFHANLYVDVSDYVRLKEEALSAYMSEMRAAPHPRSLEVASAQLKLWGSVVGLDAAEAFQVGRWRL
jgi:LmbE family N-acetylglucosaminyl deacetylase